MNNSNGDSSAVRQRELPRQFKKQARKQVHKLKRTYRAALSTGDADSVHDLRVVTRRLQTILDLATFPDPSKTATKARKRLRKLRHALNVRRDTDVLASAMRSRSARASSGHRRKLWNQAARETHMEGERAAKKSGRWLKRHKLSRIAPLIGKVVAKRLEGGGLSVDDLRSAVRQVHQRWKRCVREASTQLGSARFHEVRIKTKSYRYMMELVSRIIGGDQSQRLIEWLKSIQDELGQWRDQTELCRRLTAVLSQDAGLQSNPVATAMIDASRSRTQLNDEHAQRVITSMRESDASKQLAAVANPAGAEK